MANVMAQDKVGALRWPDRAGQVIEPSANHLPVLSPAELATISLVLHYLSIYII